MNKYIIDDGRRDRYRCKYIHKHILVYIYIQIKRDIQERKKTVAVFVFVDIFIVDYKKNKIIFYSKLKNDENYGKFKK